jgi:high-affinity nickel-transport protein
MPPDPMGRLAAVPRGFSRREWAVVVALLGAIGAATVAGFVGSFYIGSHWPVLAGLGLVAYVLGLRHGFDADHIAAIDNTTRKLVYDGRRPLTVGTWFSLGHSTIVCGLIVALVVVTGLVREAIPALQSTGAVVGTVVSGAVLFTLGVVNLAIVREVLRTFRRARAGTFDESEYERELGNRGFLYRAFRRLFSTVHEPWQIYPIGLLFGLGFDTATEVTLIALSVGVGVSGAIPITTVLVLPLLFTCGMVLSDTADGLAMRYAYGWAQDNPLRKIFYNLALTVISVLVAFVVAGVELLGVVAQELGLGGWFWGGLARVPFDTLGYAIVVLFVVAWLVAMAVYRVRGYDRMTRPIARPIDAEAPARAGEAKG